MPRPSRPARRVLMVAYHFPPLAGSSGIQRALRFVQHLPDLGWEPLVLTASPLAYERTSPDLDGEVPPGTVVERAFAMDSARHLSIAGRQWAALARPDRWMTWRFDAMRRGSLMIRELKPHVIWTTFPIATAHAIGARLQHVSGLPWIADFRDLMAQEGYPADPVTWRQYVELERLATREARLCTFTLPGTRRTYADRYPDAAVCMRTLENGYDESSFTRAEERVRGLGALVPGRHVLLHSGIVYPSERDPTELFRALSSIRSNGPTKLLLSFRAAVHEGLLAEFAAAHGVQDMVEILPPLPYQAALEEMLRADGLVLMQASNCNEQIPAKLYEYLRARRPILCLSDFAGDTWRVLERAGLRHGAALNDAQQIGDLLTRALMQGPDGLLPSEQSVQEASRAGRARLLATWLDECTQSIPT